MNQPTALIVHCTDSPDSLDVGRAEIDEWHKKKGWRGIGYHYVVRRSGAVEVGRGENEVGAHAIGYNDRSLGVVWVGQTEPSDEQRASLVSLLRDLQEKHSIPADRVFGHHEVNPGRTCPNLDCDQLRRELGAKGKAP